MAGEIAVVLAFIAVGGTFAAAEIALVSLRPGQVSRLAATHRRGLRVQRLVQQPNRFLSASQIGVTLAGFGLNIVLFHILVDVLGVWYPLGQCIATTGLLAFNFLVNLLYTFSPQRAGSRSTASRFPWSLIRRWDGAGWK